MIKKLATYLLIALGCLLHPSVLRASTPVGAHKCDTPVRTLVWLNDDASHAEAEVDAQVHNLGGTIVARCGKWCTVELDADSLAALSRLRQVKSVDTPHRLHLHNNAARRLTGVDSILVGQGLTRSFDGHGVVIGVIDVGIDYNHLAFRNHDGSTRIARVYRPCDNQGGKVILDGMQLPGSEYFPEDIPALTSAEFTNSHGTHTTATAAGTAVNNYGGMAPGAELVLCDIPIDSLTDEKAMYAAWYIARYAQSVNRPCVINMSLGNHDGPHDGNGMLSRVIDDINEQTGAIFVTSAGNEGASDLYLNKCFAPGDTVCYTHLSAVNHRIDTQVDAWSRDKTPFAVCYQLYSREQGLLASTSWITADTLINMANQGLNVSGTIEVKTAVNPVTGKHHVLAVPKLNMSDIFLRLGFKGHEGQTIDVWSCDGLDLKSLGIDSCMAGTPDCSISDLATSQQCISVGAYVSRLYYPILNGGTLPSGGATGSRSYFSSYGVDICGHTQPLVMAPGQPTISALNRYVTAESAPLVALEEDEQGNTYYWGAKSGTSMAAPVVTGIIALWLEANPHLSADDVKQIIAETAIRDKYVLAEPETCGHGKINALDGLKTIMTSAIQPTWDNSRLLNVDFNKGCIDIESLTTDTNISLTVNTLQGSIVYHRQLPLSQSGKTSVALPQLTPGVYLITARTSTICKTLKIVIR